MSAEVEKVRRLKSPYERGFDDAMKRWQEKCAGVDEVVQTIANSLHAEYPSGEEYPDARAFHWSEGQVGYSISMLLQGLPYREREIVLRIYGQTWIDDETKGVRRAVTPYHVDLQTPVRPRVLQGVIDGLLSDLFEYSAALTLPNRVKSAVPIVEHPLSKPPGQL